MYLFLGGLSAGVMIMSSLANLRGRASGQACDPNTEIHCVKGGLIAPIILAVGMLFIFLDLNRKMNMYWFYLTFQPTAPMSWGAWGIGLILPLSFLYGLSAVPEEYRVILRIDLLKRLSYKLNPYIRQLAIMNFVLGVFLGIYTGVLLSSYLARPLWNASILPLLFLTSAASTGAALLIIIIARRNDLKLFFTKIDVWLILLEIFVLILFFFGQYTSTESHRQAVMPFFTYTHEYFPYWISIFLMSILFPLALIIKVAGHRQEESGKLSEGDIVKMNLSAAMVLIGGFVLRMALVYAGQLSKLT